METKFFEESQCRETGSKKMELREKKKNLILAQKQISQFILLQDSMEIYWPVCISVCELVWLLSIRVTRKGAEKFSARRRIHSQILFDILNVSNSQHFRNF